MNQIVEQVDEQIEDAIGESDALRFYESGEDVGLHLALSPNVVASHCTCCSTYW